VKHCQWCLKRIWPWQAAVRIDAGHAHGRCIIRDVERRGLIMHDELRAYLERGEKS